MSEFFPQNKMLSKIQTDVCLGCSSPMLQGAHWCSFSSPGQQEEDQQIIPVERRRFKITSKHQENKLCLYNKQLLRGESSSLHEDEEICFTTEER